MVEGVSDEIKAKAQEFFDQANKGRVTKEYKIELQEFIREHFDPTCKICLKAKCHNGLTFALNRLKKWVE